MTIKKIIKLFIPPIFISFFRLFRKKNIENISLPSFYSTINNHSKKTDKIIILGNGPSLKSQLTNTIDFLKSNVCVCVNSFVSTEYYSIIKPKVYLLIDPNLFTVNADHESEKNRISIFDNIFSKTTWYMDLVVCNKYKNNDRIIKLKENKNINVLFINLDNYYTYNTKEERFELFNKNLIEAPAQTVINTAVYLGIFWRYKTIILIGADTSLHEEIKIDQKSNVLFIEDKHFYGTKQRLIYKDSEQTIPFKIHELLHSIANMFELYWLLREYADFNNVKVLNASLNSYIDAFERITIENN